MEYLFLKLTDIIYPDFSFQFCHEAAVSSQYQQRQMMHIFIPHNKIHELETYECIHKLNTGWQK